MPSWAPPTETRSSHAATAGLCECSVRVCRCVWWGAGLSQRFRVYLPRSQTFSRIALPSRCTTERCSTPSSRARASRPRPRHCDRCTLRPRSAPQPRDRSPPSRCSPSARRQEVRHATSPSHRRRTLIHLHSPREQLPTPPTPTCRVTRHAPPCPVHRRQGGRRLHRARVRRIGRVARR